MLILVAVIIIVPWSGHGGSPADEAAAVMACRKVAGQLPSPWTNQEPRTGAAPDSPFRSAPMYVPARSQAREAAARQTDPARALRLAQIADQPTAVWFTDPAVTGAELTSRVAELVTTARGAGQVPTLVAYAIPLRDCGGYSAGGAPSATAYLEWVSAFAAGLRQGGGSAAVILEPDALGLLDRLPAERRRERLDLLRAAVAVLGEVQGTGVYLDAGHPDWLTPAEAADRLSKAGIAGARGFAVNVSNFRRAEVVVDYGRQVSGRVGWKGFVVDTGRSGNGAPTDSAATSGVEQWCNPPGRALGPRPTADPAANVDAYLWIKPPGESDGDCDRGNPPAGMFWPVYADELARNAGW